MLTFQVPASGFGTAWPKARFQLPPQLGSFVSFLARPFPSWDWCRIHLSEVLQSHIISGQSKVTEKPLQGSRAHSCPKVYGQWGAESDDDLYHYKGLPRRQVAAAPEAEALGTGHSGTSQKFQYLHRCKQQRAAGSRQWLNCPEPWIQPRPGWCRTWWRC